MNESIFQQVFDIDDFESRTKQLLDLVSEHFQQTIHNRKKNTLSWNEPNNELKFWRAFFENGNVDEFFSEILKRT
ncbi:MAG: hypothetical protein AAFY00_04410, partial [Bacteroidota bacterium]